MAKIPEFYQPNRIGTLFYPDAATIAHAAAAAGLLPAAEDRQRVHLLIIDMQVDFCHEQGSLYVAGAREDIRRLIEFLYRHAERISQITCSLDSHLPHQIFHPAWWADDHGRHPAPFTVITEKDVAAGRWRPLREPDWSRQYVRRLRERARKELLIWPYHVPIGGVGSALDPELWSAVFWHSIARQSQPTWWTKGSLPQTEHYSILQPEIPPPGRSPGPEREAFLDALRRYDQILIAGEAASHCVLETVEDLVEEFSDEPQVLAKVFILEDCTSPVHHPDIDFGAITARAFAEYQQRGIRFLRSTDPLPF